MASIKIIDRNTGKLLTKPDSPFSHLSDSFPPWGLKEVPEGHTLYLYECFDGPTSAKIAKDKGPKITYLNEAKARIDPDHFSSTDGSIVWRAVLHMEGTVLKDLITLYWGMLSYLGCEVPEGILLTKEEVASKPTEEEDKPGSNCS